MTSSLVKKDRLPYKVEPADFIKWNLELYEDAKHRQCNPDFTSEFGANNLVL